MTESDYNILVKTTTYQHNAMAGYCKEGLYYGKKKYSKITAESRQFWEKMETNTTIDRRAPGAPFFPFSFTISILL